MELQAFKKIAPQIDREIEAILGKHGLKMKGRTASIDSVGGEIRITIKATDTNMKDADGNTTTAEAAYYNKMGTLFGLKSEWLGQTFTVDGVKYTLTGLRNTRGAKCVTIARMSDKKSFVCTPEQIIRAFPAV